MAARPLDATKQALVRDLATRYRIAAPPMRTIVDATEAAAKAVHLDPLLLLAMISVESSFDAKATSTIGARGLMQVVPRYHLEKLAPLGGEAALFDPHVNTLVGAQILREFLGRSGGDLIAALQGYSGWQDDERNRYAGKVLAELRRLRALLRRSHENPPRPSEEAAAGEEPSEGPSS